MNPKVILRNIATAFVLDVAQLQAVFALSGQDVSENDLEVLLSAQEETPVGEGDAVHLVLFLEGLIALYRGKKDGESFHLPDESVAASNNDVLKKLRIALNFHEKDVREALALSSVQLSKSDFSALFRKAGHPHFRPCSDALLMSFINGAGQLRDMRQQGS